MTEAELQPTEEINEGSEIEEGAEIPEGEQAAEGEAGKPEGEKENPSEEHPDWYVKAINRQHKKYQDEARKTAELAEENQRLKSQIPEQKKPEIPPVPDPYDDNFENKVAARDTAIREAAEYDARQKVFEAYQVQQAQAQQQQQVDNLVQTATSYSERAVKLGVKPDELQVAGNTVATFGINDDVTSYILTDEQGPLITLHLAKNPGELEALRMMTPVQAAVHIATKIKPNVDAQGGISGAPTPPDTLDGGGTGKTDEGPEGATYE